MNSKQDILNNVKAEALESARMHTSDQSDPTDPSVLSRAQERALRQEWRTPPEFFEVLDAEFGFEIDVAASRDNSLCSQFLKVEHDALAETTHWFTYASHAYCNPGFSNLDPWVRKAHAEVNAELRPCTAVVLSCASHAKWFEFCARHASEIRLLSPRVQFLPPPGIKPSSNARDSVLIVFRKTPVGWPGAHIWNWNWKEQTCWAEREGLKVEIVAPQTWQSGYGIAGKREKRKPLAMEIAKRLGYQGSSQDEADAVCLANYAECHGRQEELALTGPRGGTWRPKRKGKRSA